MITRTRVGAAVAIAALLVTACSSGGADERSEPVETEGDPKTSRPTDSTTTTIEPSPPTTAEGLSADEEQVLGAITLGLTQELDGTSLAPPDGACFHRALASMDEAAQGAAEYLATNVTGWSGLDPSASRPLVAAFIGCSDLASVHMSLAISLIGALDTVPCVVDAWEATLTEEVIVDSIAEGSGLDDLPEPDVQTLTDGARGCVPDTAWWVEDIAIDIAPSFSLTPTQATCVVEAYVQTFGVDAAIRRRILTVPTLTVPPAELMALDLPARCGTDHVAVPVPVDLDEGDCITGFGDEEREQVVACSAPHDATVLAVFDLDADGAGWPGVRAVRADAATRCRDAAGPVLDGMDGFVGSWSAPGRLVWEQGRRQLVCVAAHDDGSSWTDVEIAPPSAPIFVDDVVVGQCLLGAALVDGDIGDGMVQPVDCNDVHHAEVYHVSTLDPAAGGGFPGDQIAQNTALSRCHPSFDEYVGKVWADSRLGFTYVYPTAADWAAGSHTLVCYLWDREAAPLNASMAGSGE